MRQRQDIEKFSSISQLMRRLDQPSPLHPMVALVDYEHVLPEVFRAGTRVMLDFYKISFKRSFNGKVKYGQGHYDFEEGGLAFLKPRQIVTTSGGPDSYQGYVLYFHADLIRDYPVGKTINRYGFFSYAVSEALFLSKKEKSTIGNLFESIATELGNNIDQFSQDVLVSQLVLLLSHSDRFYHRQFLTRKTVSHEIVASLDNLLETHFTSESGLEGGLPTVSYISDQLKVSQRYLSDMLVSLTGYTAQQYIQNTMIEKSKDLLSSTTLSVAEIAYQLGFEHPQSFSKLFRAKTALSPLEFRRTFD